MDIFDPIFQYLSGNPHVGDLLTVAGLGLFLKLVFIPLAKTFCQWRGIDISGTKTVLLVYVGAILTVIVATIITGGAWNWGVLLLLIYTGSKEAIGLQQTMTALRRPDKL